MERRDLLLLATLLGVCPGPAWAQEGMTEAWRDAARARTIPVRLRLPREPGPRPVVLISHGLGGSRDGLGYLGRGLAKAGFVAIHLQHPGTDSAVWNGVEDRRTSLVAAALDARNAIARLQDGIFALDELERCNEAAGPLHGRLDLERIAFAGHSYGAWTVQHLIGQRLPGGDRGLALPDARIKAGIALSPVPSRGLPLRVAFARVATPLLHVTGTEDRGYIDGATPEDRQSLFHAISGPPQALAVLGGAAHAAFADEPAAGPRWSDPTYHLRTAGLAVAFLQAVLLRDRTAVAFLRDGAPGLLAPADRLLLKDFEGIV